MTTRTHFVNGQPLDPPFAPGLEQAIFGMGCFWGAERLFWELPGVVVTAVGYAGGTVPDPTYKQVCTDRTGHAEVVRVVYDPKRTSYPALLKAFWEHHDPTQGNRQGNDIGSQYRSVIHACTDQQLDIAAQSREQYQAALHAAGRGRITTQIEKALVFYYAEDYHQQYLAKNPEGYCGIGGCGVTFKPEVLLAGEKA